MRPVPSGKKEQVKPEYKALLEEAAKIKTESLSVDKEKVLFAAELINAGLLSGSAPRGGKGIPFCATVSGITAAGWRELEEDEKERKGKRDAALVRWTDRAITVAVAVACSAIAAWAAIRAAR